MNNFIIKVGDKLKVREDLRAEMDVPHGTNGYMARSKGKIVTVISVPAYSHNHFDIEGSSYTWSREMFEEIIEDYNRRNDCEELHLQMAIGMAVYSSETDKEYMDVFRRADSAMYEDKKQKKQKSK